MAASIDLLSRRAQDLAKPSPGTVIWKVLNDQWDPQTNPDGYLSLGVAENRLMHDTMEQCIAHLGETAQVPSKAFTYGDGPCGSHRLRKATANFLTKHLRPVQPVEEDQVVVTNGVSHAIEHMSWSLCNPGEGMLLGQPYYGAFVSLAS